MTAARLAVACRALLGPIEGELVVVAPHRATFAGALAASSNGAGRPAAGGVIVWLGAAANAATREKVLREVWAQLGRGAPLVVADHNQPRAGVLRLVSALYLVARGFAPARARYPVARELVAHGFRVECLRLHAHERVQLVRAVRVD